MRPAPRAMLTSAALAILLAATAPLAAAQTDVVFPGACRDVLAADAKASGRGVPIYVALNGEAVLTTDPPAAEASLSGPGKAGDRVGAIDIAIPNEENPIVAAQILTSRVDLDVDNESEGLEAEAWTISRVAHLNVLDGLVTADIVRGFAYARTDVRSARTWTDPSTIVNLRVNGVSVTDISPGANITLPEVLFGPGSYVTVYERVDESRRPTEEDPRYIADVRVRMIAVHIEKMPLLGMVDVIVSEAYAHAETPTPFCGVAQSVEAGGYTLRIRDALEEPGILVGEQHIGVTGGSAHQQLLGEHLTILGAEVLLNVTETDMEGTIVAGGYSKSDAMSQVLGLCIRLDAEAEAPDCFIEAVLVRAEAHCYADEDGASCEGKTTILKLVIDGVDVCAALGQDQDDEGICEPGVGAKVVEIAGITVTLNQQERVQTDGFASLYVRAIRIDGVPLLGTVVIGRAYASAGYEDVSANAQTPAWDL